MDRGVPNGESGSVLAGSLVGTVARLHRRSSVLHELGLDPPQTPHVVGAGMDWERWGGTPRWTGARILHHPPLICPVRGI